MAANWGALWASTRTPEMPIYASASTGQDDLSFAGYQKHLSSCAAPAPLTSAERELQQIRINEVGLPNRVRSGSPRTLRSHQAQLAEPMLSR